MNTKKIIISGLAFGTMLLPSLPASAAIDEALIYPGVNCKEFVSSGSAGQLSIRNFAELFNNTSSSVLAVTCPMSDRGNNLTGDVWVFDNNSTADPFCQSFAANPFDDAQNTSVTAVNPSSTTAIGGLVKQIHFDGPIRNGTFTYRYYFCSFPPRTGIINYRGLAN